jgi:restriction endonuclease Mrr
MKERLLPEDKEKVPSGRAIRWENLASFERKKMVQEGLLADNTPRIWQITEAGRAYLQRMRDGGGDK